MLKNSKLKLIIGIGVILALLVVTLILIFNHNKSSEEKYISQIQRNNIEEDIIIIENIKDAIDQIQSRDSTTYITQVTEQLDTMKSINEKLVIKIDKVKVEESLMESHQNLYQYAALNEEIIVKMEGLIEGYDNLNQATTDEALEESYTAILLNVDEIIELTQEANTYQTIWFEDYQLMETLVSQ
jgi:hypothetical protein